MLAGKADMRKVDRRQLSHKACVLLRNYENLLVDDKELLFRKISPKKQKQIALMLKFRPLVYSELQAKMGYLVFDQSMQPIEGRFYWSGIRSDNFHFITKACSCVKKKRPPKLEKVPLKCISTNAPIEIFGLDFLHLDPCQGKYFLLITDHFSGFTQAYPAANKKAKTAAEILYYDFMLRFGLPEKILHDQFREFENNIFKKLAKLDKNNTIPSPTPPSTPQPPTPQKNNGKVEHMNQTSISMLQTLPGLHKSRWKDHIQKLVFGYNCTKHSRTGYFTIFPTLW